MTLLEPTTAALCLKLTRFRVAPLLADLLCPGPRTDYRAWTPLEVIAARKHPDAIKGWTPPRWSFPPHDILTFAPTTEPL